MILDVNSDLFGVGGLFIVVMGFVFEVGDVISLCDDMIGSSGIQILGISMLIVVVDMMVFDLVMFINSVVGVQVEYDIGIGKINIILNMIFVVYNSDVGNGLFFFVDIVVVIVVNFNVDM